jgi:hypothetical protein
MDTDIHEEAMNKGTQEDIAALQVSLALGFLIKVHSCFSVSICG